MLRFEASLDEETSPMQVFTEFACERLLVPFFSIRFTSFHFEYKNNTFALVVSKGYMRDTLTISQTEMIQQSIILFNIHNGKI